MVVQRRSAPDYLIVMIHYNNHKLPYGLEYIGDGFTIRKTASCYGMATLEFFRGLCQHLIAHPDPMIVPIYRFEYLGAYSNNDHRYSYDMMRVGDLSREEKEIVWQVGDAWRFFYNQPIDPTRKFKVNAVLTSEECWAKHPQLMHFLKEVIVLNRYHDLHGENVMMDNDGQFRLIDLESFHNPPLSKPSNNWITQVSLGELNGSQ